MNYDHNGNMIQQTILNTGQDVTNLKGLMNSAFPGVDKLGEAMGLTANLENFMVDNLNLENINETETK